MRTLIVFLLAATATSAAAQNTPSPHVPVNGGRTIGAHTFTPLSIVNTPFVGTSFTSAIGAAMASNVIDAIIVDVGGTQDTLLPSGDMVLGTYEMRFQQNIARRFALNASFGINARSGTNARLIFAEGISGVTQASIGGLARLHRGDRSILTASVDYRGGNLTELTPKEFAQYVAQYGIDSLQYWGDHLLQTRRNSRLVGGLRGAYVVNPWLGLMASAEGGQANLYEQGKDFTTQLGAGASVDLRHTGAHAPIGLALGVGLITSPTRSDDLFGTTTTTNLGVYYNGRDELAIGVDLQVARASLIAVDDHVNLSFARFVVRYDF